MSNLDIVEEIIGYKFNDRKYLNRALTHSSYANLHGVKSYDRLEFLGDALLDFIVAEELCKRYTDTSEGDLTRWRSEIVSSEPLNNVAQELHLDKCIVTLLTPDQSQKMCSDVIESIIAAMYIDSGDNIAPCRDFVLKNLSKYIKDAPQNCQDYKSRLLEKFGAKNVSFEVLDREGPDNAPVFQIGLIINGKKINSAKATNKKKAEQLCAKLFFESI